MKQVDQATGNAMIKQSKLEKDVLLQKLLNATAFTSLDNRRSNVNNDRWLLLVNKGMDPFINIMSFIEANRIKLN